MAQQSRTYNSIKNSKIALIYSVCGFVVGFFSRKIFLDHLGADVLGLNTTASNLLQFLNLAEMGIAAAISITLYKPFFNNDRNAINEIISIQGWLYRRMGSLVMGSAIVLMAFFPLIFNNINLPLWYAYATFSVLLFSALLGYFVNYKSILLSANQQEYVVVLNYNSIRSFIKVIFQIFAIAYLHNGYIWWLVLEVVFNIIASITLNRAIKLRNPWLKTQISRGKELSKKYPDVSTKIKQVFFHKIGGFVLTQTQPLIIYGFTSLALVAYYGNYLFIISGLTILINAIFNGMGASVGHLIAEGDRKKILRIFEELYSSRFLLTSVLCISTYLMTPSFITLWLGEEYIMENTTLFLMLTSFFIIGVRGAVENYIGALGLYKDIWAPIAEAALNLGCSILLGSIYGLNGILLGAIISLIIIILIWKPYFLFRWGLNEPYYKFLTIFLKHIAVIGLIVLFLYFANLKFSLTSLGNPYLSFIVNGFIVVSCSTIVVGLMLYLVSIGMRDFCKRVINKIK